MLQYSSYNFFDIFSQLILQIYSVSTRQRQLAVLTPSQLIELAYLSALLEQYPFHNLQPISDKVENIKEFLEKIVQVVPLESITYAMAYSPYKLAKFCAESLIKFKDDLPASQLMQHGLHYAQLHLREGTVSAIDTFERADLQISDEYPHLDEHTVIQGPTGKIVQEPSMGIVASATIKSAEIPDDELIHPKYVEDIRLMNKRLSKDRLRNRFICETSIEDLYCINSHSESQQQSLFKSPLDILRKGKSKLKQLAKKLIDAKEKKPSKTCNVEMLEKVNNIREFDLAICIALLGGFMEQQKIEIPLMKSPSMAFAINGPASVGVWALSSLKYEDIHPILSRCHGEQLLVNIEPYIKSISSQQFEEQYAAKLQFMVQGLKKTVTYNSQHVSYSLERQLVRICEERFINSETSLDKLNKEWGIFFKENILSLVAHTHRSLVARWLKWALMVHSLREKLAEYTAVGVVGLVNSGKSTLVSSLFKIPVSLAHIHVHTHLNSKYTVSNIYYIHIAHFLFKISVI